MKKDEPLNSERSGAFNARSLTHTGVPSRDLGVESSALGCPFPHALDPGSTIERSGSCLNLSAWIGPPRGQSPESCRRDDLTSRGRHAVHSSSPAPPARARVASMHRLYAARVHARPPAVRPPAVTVVHVPRLLGPIPCEPPRLAGALGSAHDRAAPAPPEAGESGWKLGVSRRVQARY